MKKKGSFNLSVGASSILMIFVVLCLTTFGILSYVTANADAKISTKSAEMVENYYAGSTAAEKLLQKVDSTLLAAKSDAKLAVDRGNVDATKYDSSYKSHDQIQSVVEIINGTLPKEQKYDLIYRSFSEMLLTSIPGSSIDAGTDAEPLRFTYVTDAGGGHHIETKLTVNPYADGNRYTVTSKKLISDQALVDSEETLQLWQGSSAQ